MSAEAINLEVVALERERAAVAESRARKDALEVGAMAVRAVFEAAYCTDAFEALEIVRAALKRMAPLLAVMQERRGQ